MVSIPCLTSITLVVSSDSVFTISIEAFVFGMWLRWVLLLAPIRIFVDLFLFSYRQIKLSITLRFSSVVRLLGCICFQRVLSFSYFTSLCVHFLPFFPNFLSPSLRLWTWANQRHVLSFLFLLAISRLSVWHIASSNVLVSFSLKNLVWPFFCWR